MTTWLAGFASENAADLCLADGELGGKLSLRDARPDGFDLYYLGISQSNIGGMFSDLTPLHAVPRTMGAFPREEGRTTGGTSALGGRVCQGGAWPVWSSVVCSMSRAGNQLKVLQAIVGLNPITMVDDLIGAQRAANCLADHQTMFQDVPRPRSGIGMIGSGDHDISRPGSRATASPARIATLSMAVSSFPPDIALSRTEPPVGRFADDTEWLAATTATETGPFIGHGMTNDTRERVSSQPG